MAIVKQIGILALLAGLATGGYVGWQELFGASADARQDSRARARNRSVIVETQAAQFRDLETLVDAIGSTRAHRAVEITPMADGRVVAIGFRAGQSVEAGEPLLRLDDEIQRADLVEAQARVTAAEKALGRARRLRKTSSVAVATVDTLIAELAIAQADRDRAARRLRDRTVVAPFAGIVGFSNVELGARIDKGDTVTTLDDLSLLEIELSLPESLFGRIGPGQSIKADAAAYPGRTFEGTIETISSRIDPQSRSFKVRALVSNSDLVLPTGMFMHLTVVLDAERALVVPEEALVVDGSTAFVFAIVKHGEEERAERRTVTIGRRAFGVVEIISGIEPGMDVVTRGVQKVREGSLVRHAAPAEKSSAPGARRDERARATRRQVRGIANDGAAVG